MLTPSLVFAYWMRGSIILFLVPCSLFLRYDRPHSDRLDDALQLALDRGRRTQTPADVRASDRTVTDTSTSLGAASSAERAPRCSPSRRKHCSPRG